MERRAKNNSDDVPVPAAVALLGIVVVFLFGWNSRADLMFKAERLAQIIEQNATEAILVGISLTLNLVWSSLVISRVVGLKKQGARLRRIVQDKNVKGSRGKRLAIGFAYVFGSFLTTWLLIPETVIGLHQWPFGVEVRNYIYLGVWISEGMSLAIVISLVRGIRLQGFLFKKKVALSPMPKPVNGIVLGAIGEPSFEECA